MSKPHIRHEQLLFRYSSALERGDFEAVADVLREAERDSALEAMILEMNDAYTAERFNHTNPREIPMIAAIYQNPLQQRAQTRRFQWHSLPLIAAVAVIALLSVMLAVQIRGNTVFNTGQPNAGSALGLVNAICTATTRAVVDVLSLPGTGGVILGSIPSGESIAVLEQKRFLDYQGSATTWYFVTAGALQGWITTERLDAQGCPEVTFIADLPMIVPVSPDQPIPRTAMLPSYITVACRAITYATADVFSIPSWNGITTGSIPRGRQVTVGDYSVYVDPQGSRTLWYFVKADGIQGWVLTSLLDASACPPIPDESSESTTLPPTIVSPIVTATPVPFGNDQGSLETPVPSISSLPSANPSCDIGIGSASLPFNVYLRPGYDAPIVLESSSPDPHSITWLGSTTHAGSLWYLIRVDSALGLIDGWITEEQYNTQITCALLNRGEQPTVVPPASIQAQAVEVTPTPSPFVERQFTQMAETQLFMSATAIIQQATASAAADQPSPIPAVAQATATPMIIPPFVASDSEGNPIYIVQEGDTLLSILARVNLDLGALPELLRLNDLEPDIVPLPGTVLRLPLSVSAYVTLCRVKPDQELQVRAQPSGDAPLIATFGGGTEFQVVNAPGASGDEPWLMINAALTGVTIQNAWVESAALDFVTDCGLVLPTTGRTDMPPLVLTATLFSATLLPPTLELLATTTPIPSPTLVR